MPSSVVKVLRRTLAGVLCYGFVFSYPSWTIIGRLSAEEPKPDRITDTGVPANPPAKAKSKEDVGFVPKTHQEDKDEDAPKRRHRAEKEIPAVPPAMSCSDDNLYLGAVNNYGKKKANPGDLCGSLYNGPVGEKCWTQVYMLLAAADANANYYHNPEVDPAKGTALNSAVENSYLNMKDFRHDVLAADLGREPTKKSYAEVIDQMSNPDIIQGIDHKACCMELVEKAQHVGDYIKSTRSPKPEYNLKVGDVARFDQLFAKQKERCEASHAGVVVVPPPPAKEKKKTNWWLIGGIALLVGGLLYLLLHKKKKGKKHPKKRKTEKPKPCKKAGCEGGTTGTEATTTAGTTTVNPNTVTGGSATGNTYPATTGENNGRDNTTGESTGNTAVTNGNNPGRDVENTTGTVTGSTTATTGSNTGTDSGGDTYPSNGDRPNDRTTSGTPRTLTPSRTLMK